MTCVALFGGTGRLGREVLTALLARDIAVRLLIRSPGARSDAEGLGCVVGNIHDPNAVKAVLDGTDAVISTLGSAGEPVADISSAAIANIGPAMMSRGARRIVSTTGSAARLDNEIGAEHPWLAARRTMLMHHIAPLVLDGEEHMRLLAASGLDWTVVRAPIMTTEGRTPVRLAAIPAAPDSTLSYGKVAEAIVDELLDPRWIGEAPFLVAA